MATFIEEVPPCSIKIPAPWTLKIGRKAKVITEMGEIWVRRSLAVQRGDDESLLNQYSFPLPCYDRYDLYIGDKLFSTTTPSGKRRATVFLRKSRGPEVKNVEICLTRKYTTLAAGVSCQ